MKKEKGESEDRGVALMLLEPTARSKQPDAQSSTHVKQAEGEAEQLVTLNTDT